MAPLQSDLQRSFQSNLRFTFAASGLLARQIENGAPYDLYLSANRKFVDELARAGKLEPDSVHVYAIGRLGLWSRSGRYRTVESLREAGAVAIANPQLAPYGAAARELLERHGVWKALEGRIVYGENVRQALQYAETGNADAVITSWSLVSASGAVLLPPEHAPVIQSGGVVAGSKHAATARKFLAWLTGPGGRTVLSAHGLEPPGNANPKPPARPDSGVRPSPRP